MKTTRTNSERRQDAAFAVWLGLWFGIIELILIFAYVGDAN